MSRVNYIFVDFENVHEVDLDLVAGKHVIVNLVLGEQHKKLPLELVERLVKYREQVRLVKVGKAGKNALDFVLAYRIGVESALESAGFYHIVTRDTGFDALILHLRNHGVLARRDESFVEAFKGWETPLVSPEERVKIVREKLAKNKASRPKKKKTLLSQINSYFGKKLSDDELEDVVQKLIGKKVIELGSKGEITYKS